MLRRISLGLVLALAACGTASIVNRDQSGGTIRYQGDRGKASEQAQWLMAQYCGIGQYKIVSEGVEPIGTGTYATQQTQDTEHTSSSRTTDTTTVTSPGTAVEYRIHYQCIAAPGAAPPPGVDPNATPAPSGPPSSASPPRD